MICQTCLRVQQPEGFWLPVSEPPSGPVSHGVCPTCKADYLRVLDRLKAASDPATFKRPAWWKPVGCSALHPEDKDPDGGARVVRDEP